jgi:raffinose/stachyose/melibiose transport system permease protein
MNLDQKTHRQLNAIVVNVALLVVCFLMLIPWILALSTALKAPGETAFNPGLIPQHIDLAKFVDVYVRADVGRLALNSLIITGSSVVLVLFFSSLAAYAFARLDFVFKEPLYFLFLIGLMLQAAALIVPLYQIDVAYKLLNTYFGLIGPYVALGLPFSILILRGFFESLPSELQDAALIDGASRFTIYWRIYLPLTRPALVTVGIFQGLGIWNDFLLPLLLTSKPEMQTLPLGLLAFQTSFFVQIEHSFALIVMMILPVFVLFLLLQRQFMSGLTAGALKG